jgi:hypothetical protein
LILAENLETGSFSIVDETPENLALMVKEIAKHNSKFAKALIADLEDILNVKVNERHKLHDYIKNETQSHLDTIT